MRSYSIALICLGCACGGKVAYETGSGGDAGGSGGVSGTSGGPSPSGSGGSANSPNGGFTNGGSGNTGNRSTGGHGAGTGEDCDILSEVLTNSIAAAQECDPLINAVQCTGEVAVLDHCECDVLANENNPEAAEDALVAFDAWVNLGCGPLDCFGCPSRGPGACISDGVCESLSF